MRTTRVNGLDRTVERADVFNTKLAEELTALSIRAMRRWSMLDSSG
jgi:hypothetical protein